MKVKDAPPEVTVSIAGGIAVAISAAYTAMKAYTGQEVDIYAVAITTLMAVGGYFLAEHHYNQLSPKAMDKAEEILKPDVADDLPTG